MRLAFSCHGFEIDALRFGLIVYSNDFEVRVGPYALSLLPDGLFLRTRSDDRCWPWWEVRSWFSRSGHQSYAPEGLLKEDSVLPELSTVRPADALDTKQIKDSLGAVSELLSRYSTPTQYLPHTARALRAQAVKLLQTADEIELTVASAPAETGMA